MGFWDIVIIVLVVVVVAAALVFILKGKSSCSDCASCPGAGSCKKKGKK